MAELPLWDIDDGQPPDLGVVFGEVVTWIGLLPSRTGLLFICGEHAVEIQIVPVPAGHKYRIALNVKVGYLRSDAQAMARELEQGGMVVNHYTRALAGQRFAGLDNNVLAFGSDKGIAMEADGVRFVQIKRS